MKKWVLSNCAILGKDLSGGEITSLSWDCFMFCLDRFKPDGPIDLPRHFHQYTKYYLLMKASGIRKEQKDIVSLDEVDFRSIETEPSCHPMFDLMNFRGSLPDDYQLLLDDVLSTLVTRRASTVSKEVGKGTIKRHRYLEAKKILSFVVKFFLASR